MAFCKYTEQIYDYECLGDSLQKINQNFTKLNEVACEVPELVAGPGISVIMILPNRIKTQPQLLLKIHLIIDQHLSP